MTEPARALPQLIAVDIGNTSTRFGLFDRLGGSEPPAARNVLATATRGITSQRLLGRLPPEPCTWRIASVCRGAQQRLAAWVQRNRPADDYRLLTHQDMPLAIEVDFPERVGLDRLAAAVAANRLRSPHRCAVVIDAGTALTVDLVGATGAFLGGVILPGFAIAARALANETDLLPMIRFSTSGQPPPVVGKSTEAAIRSGLYWGSLGAVRELVDRMSRQLQSDPEIFVTGGDAVALATQLGASARFVPDLVLIGIAWAASSALIGQELRIGGQNSR
jgi:type III pantothenate kinase